MLQAIIFFLFFFFGCNLVYGGDTARDLKFSLISARSWIARRAFVPRVRLDEFVFVLIFLCLFVCVCVNGVCCGFACCGYRNGVGRTIEVLRPRSSYWNFLSEYT